jgi:catechol 2,3-dioxygenase-like lactoylglutathione lyase family enzyme
MSNGPPPRLVPELDVSDLRASLRFYVDIIGFGVRHERPEEAFVYLELAGAAIMLEEADGPGRRFRTAPLERPFGRGVNLQVEVADVGAIHDRVRQASLTPLVALEERWYRVGDHEEGNRQFVVEDPDGYLLRLFEDLGRR